MKQRPIVKERRHQKLIQRVVKYLHAEGPKNTREILEHVNTTTRHGTVTSELTNVLSKYPKYFRRGPTARVGSALSGSYEILTWILNYEDDAQ
mgnify:FL=1